MKGSKEETLSIVYTSSINQMDVVPVKTQSGTDPKMKAMDTALIGFVRSGSARFPLTLRDAGKIISEQVRVDQDRVHAALRIDGLSIKMGPARGVVISDGVLIKVNSTNLGKGAADSIISAYKKFQERFDNDCCVVDRGKGSDVSEGDKAIADRLDMAVKAGVSPGLMVKATSGDVGAQKEVNKLIDA